MGEATIVGAGPSGLSCAILLVQAGWTVRVLEQRSEIGEHSRAIGIHPPGLRVLDAVGVGAAAQRQGVRITDGIGISRGKHLGRVDFSHLPGPHPYILSLPQNQTVHLLRERLNQLAPRALQLGTRYLHHDQLPGTQRVQVTSQSPGADTADMTETEWLIAADGTGSTVREHLGVSFTGKALADRYVMGDYPDTTDYGSTAVLFLHARGIVESFPMPNGLRRWVVHAGRGTATVPGLAQVVAERTGHRVVETERSMYSEFCTAHRQVGSLAHGRVLVIGDAAHEVSPIGGQGMTLGLADARELSTLLTGTLPVTPERLQKFSRTRLARARHAARQAHLNMRLGRPLNAALIPLRDGIFTTLAKEPRFMHAVARTFSMSNGTQDALLSR